ncbi:porin family protein [Aeromonas veronii]|uniref:porin family protein n=1 Tax=Aeromonas TaxID=642 RepID=UPI00301DE6B9
MMKLFTPLVVATAIFSSVAIATPSPHIVGATLGYGTQSFKAQNGDQADGGDNMTADLYYRYMFNDYIGIDSGILFGTGGVVSALFDATLNDVKDIHYKGIRSALYAQFPVSSGNSFYAKLGANAHRVEYTINKEDQSNSGVGLYGAAGWQYRFDSGIGLNAEYQYIPMPRLDVKGVSVGLNYRF